MKNYTTKNNLAMLEFSMLCCILFLDCFLFNSYGFAIGRLFVAVVILCSLLLSVDENIFLLAFCLPFSSVLKLSESSITILPILYLIIILKLALKEKVSCNFFSFVALGALIVLQILACVFYEASFFSVVSFALSLIFVVICGGYVSKNTEKNIYYLKNIALFFVGAVCLETVLSRIFLDIPYFISSYKHSLIVSAGRFAGLNIDPNEYAQLVLISIGLIIATIPTLNKYSHKVFCWIVIAGLVVGGFFTYSKSYALTLLAVFVVFFFIYMFKLFREKGTNGLLILIPISLLFLIGSFFIYENIILSIFEKRSGDDLLTGRGEIWLNYIIAFFNRADCFLWGFGVSNSVYLVKDLGVTHVPHNLYIEYFVQFGIIGVTMLCIGLKEQIKNILKKSKTYMGVFILAFAITSLGISANANDVVFFILMIVCIPYGYVGSKGKEKC